MTRHADHADEAGDADETKDPHAGGDAVGGNRQPVLDGIDADGIADRDQDERDGRVDGQGRVEPAARLLESGRLVRSDLGLSDRDGVEARVRAGEDAVEERDERREAADESVQPVVDRAERHQRPASAQQPEREAIQGAPVGRDDVQEDSAVLGHACVPKIVVA